MHPFHTPPLHSLPASPNPCTLTSSCSRSPVPRYSEATTTRCLAAFICTWEQQNTSSISHGVSGPEEPSAQSWQCCPPLGGCPQPQLCTGSLALREERGTHGEWLHKTQGALQSHSSTIAACKTQGRSWCFLGKCRTHSLQLNLFHMRAVTRQQLQNRDCIKIIPILGAHTLPSGVHRIPLGTKAP